MFESELSLPFLAEFHSVHDDWSARGTTPRATSSGADASVPIEGGVLLHVQASASVDPGKLLTWLSC
jgi:hypothetical protein